MGWGIFVPIFLAVGGIGYNIMVFAAVFILFAVGTYLAFRKAPRLGLCVAIASVPFAIYRKGG
jgi:hypothetical protein